MLMYRVGREADHVMGFKLVSDTVVHLPTLAFETKDCRRRDMTMHAAHRHMGRDVDDMGSEAVKWPASQNIVAGQIAGLVRATLAHDRLFRRQWFEHVRQRF